MVTGTPVLGTGVLLDLQVISTGWSILNCLPAAARLLPQRSGSDLWGESRAVAVGSLVGKATAGRAVPEGSGWRAG